MMLFRVIDALFIGTRYGVWGMSLLGIPLSMILMFCNLANGWSATILFFAALLLSCALVLLLMPKQFSQEDSLETNRHRIGAICILFSVLLAGAVYLVSGGFPQINLLY